MAFAQALVLAVTIGDEAAGLPHEGQSRCYIPRPQRPFPIAVKPPRRYPGEIKRSGAKSPYPRHVLLHGADFLSRQSDVAVSVVSDPACDDRLRKPRPCSDAKALLVEKRALALLGNEHFVGRRIVDQASDHAAVALERNRNCEVGDAMQEIGGAVERIADPHVALVGALAPAGFLSKKTISRPCLHELHVDGFFSATVGGRYEIGWSLQGDLQLFKFTKVAFDRARGLARGGNHDIEQG